MHKEYHAGPKIRNRPSFCPRLQQALPLIAENGIFYETNPIELTDRCARYGLNVLTTSREASPTATIIDTQAAKATEKGGKDRDPVGYDAGKKVKGIKRNALTDTIGLLLGIEVIPANVQDRDSAAALIKKTRRLFPFIKHIFAHGGYSGDKLATDLAAQRVTLEIVKRTDKEGGFKLIRRRWVVERTLAEGFAKLAMISVMLKRLTGSKYELTYDEWDACAKFGDCPKIGAGALWRSPWLSRMTGKKYRLLS